jgi:hypothetical protein
MAMAKIDHVTPPTMDMTPKKLATTSVWTKKGPYGFLLKGFSLIERWMDKINIIEIHLVQSNHGYVTPLTVAMAMSCYLGHGHITHCSRSHMTPPRLWAWDSTPVTVQPR